MTVSMNQTLLIFLLYERQTWVTRLILCKGLSSFNPLSSLNVTRMHVKEGLPFAWDLPLENSQGSYWSFRLALLHSMSYFFFFYRSPSSSLYTVFDSTLSNIDEVLSINLSAVFFFGDFNVHHKDWLTYSGGTDRPGELYRNFSISNVT